jgi:hypothetical protein
MKPQEELCTDLTVHRLEEELKKAPSRPDQKRRWARALIERTRVSELAAEIALRQYMDDDLFDQVWTEAVEKARARLKAMRIIR